MQKSATFLLITLLFTEIASAKIKTYTCLPVFLVISRNGYSEKENLTKDRAFKNMMLIEETKDTGVVITRGSISAQTSISGIYKVFYASNFKAKIDLDTKEYFEMVHMGLSTFTYFGKCTF